MLKRILILVAAAFAWPLAASAADEAPQFAYTYVEGGYASINPSTSAPPSVNPLGGSSSLTGFEADGSYAFDPNWHGIAGYEHVSCCGVSANVFNAGAGWNTSLAEKLDLYINGEFLSEDISGPGTHTGWAGEGGLRAQLANMFELDGFVNHSDVNSVTENTIGVRGLFAIDKFWHLYAAYSNNSDQDTFLVGVRYNF
jgi:hypothetical protein